MNELAERLRARRAELETAILTRARAVSDPASIEDPEYALGLQKAIATGLDYAISAVESGEGTAAPVPDQLLGQARAAARHGVSLDTVLRRYSAGHTLLGDYLIEEAGSAGIPSGELKRAFRAQADVYDRLVSVVSAEYAREAASRPRTAGQRRAELVKRVLAGDPADRDELRYPFECWHIGALAVGTGSLEVLRETAGTLHLQHLLVEVESEVVWGWFGDQGMLSPSLILSHATDDSTMAMTLALGELGYGIEGWRLTHRQAKAAMSVAQRGREQHLRYADAALLAAALRDDLLAESLHDIYLAPLESERDGGAALRRTLRAYLAVGGNVTSAAASLGLNRRTVSVHIRTAEERIGRPLDACAAEAELALKLQNLTSQAPAHTARAAAHIGVALDVTDS